MAFSSIWSKKGEEWGSRNRVLRALDGSVRAKMTAKEEEEDGHPFLPSWIFERAACFLFLLLLTMGKIESPEILSSDIPFFPFPFPPPPEAILCSFSILNYFPLEGNRELEIELKSIPQGRLCAVWQEMKGEGDK